ncbi:Uncharacterized membrane protein YgdD, TMEM256/DUF423 family [bacterium A37T11]|nr:Uncharacterized membrane protein YgdD, TMEM256/DUF423 family [bacterium A37T11]
MNKRIVLIASFLGLIGVILGAFGAHGLSGKVGPEQLETWKTAVNYHFYHTLALLFLSKFSRARETRIIVAAMAFTGGILLFCGSLYLLAVKDFLGIAWAHYLGPVTPLGGLLFIIGWAFLFFAAFKNK